MTYQEYMAILRYRWKAVAWTFLAIVTLSVVLSLVIPAHYKGIATVVPNLKITDPLNQSALPGAYLQNYLGTQIDIIKSPRVERKVVGLLQLDKDPELIEKWQGSTYYQPDNFVSWAANWLDKRLTVTPPRDSDVIEIKFSSKNAQFAADAANAFADTYMSANVALNTEPATTAAAWLSDINKTLRANLEGAQDKLSAFQKAHNIIATDDRIDVETTRLNELEQQLVTAQGMHADSSSRVKETSHSPAELPEVLQNGLVTSLKSEIARDQAQLDDLAARLGTSHPQYLGLLSQLESLRSREAAEERQIVGSIGGIDRVSVGREAELKAAIANQRDLVLKLRSDHDQAAVLGHDVQAAQQAYDAAASRFLESSLEAQMRQTNVALLSSAVKPYKPSWPIMWIDVLAGVFLGGLIGLGVALLREYLDLGIHSAEQLSDVVGVPALSMNIPKGPAANDGHTRWPRTRVWLRSKGILRSHA